MTSKKKKKKLSNDCLNKRGKIHGLSQCCLPLQLSGTLHSLFFLSAHLPVLFQHAHSVSLIVTLSILITHQSAHCPYQKNLEWLHFPLRKIQHKGTKLKLCYYNDFEEYSPLCCISCVGKQFLNQAILRGLFCLISAQSPLAAFKPNRFKIQKDFQN